MSMIKVKNFDKWQDCHFDKFTILANSFLFMFFLIPLFVVAKEKLGYSDKSRKLVVNSFNVDVGVDINELIDQIGRFISASVTKYSEIPTPDGGRFVGGIAEHLLFAFYYHPTRKHRVSCHAGPWGSKQPPEHVWFEPGEWAYIITNAAAFGNQCWYEDV